MPINTTFAEMPWLRDRPANAAALQAGQIFARGMEGNKNRAMDQQQIDIRREEADREAQRETQKLIGVQKFTQVRSELIAAGKKEEEANMGALMEALPYLHPEGLPQFVSRENALQSRANEGERTREFRANESEKTRQSQYDRLIETLNSRGKEVADKLQSAERITAENNAHRDAIANSRSARKVSREEFINRHAGNIHRADPSQSYQSAAREAGEIYDSDLSAGGPVSGNAPQSREESPEEKVLKQLMNAKAMGIKEGKVNKSGEFVEDGGRVWDTSIDDLIEEWTKKAKIKGGTVPAAQPAGKLPVIPFNFNSKSNSLSK